ncbi:spore protease YyaC [Lentibacillus saliphilus]|uniref:spore protease YyaC n=1 Tax=Lentibacillus saliphilus TaxID=2737028 RepID=UPI001C3051AF|nr:spore protease YyaC [Lentibacillus saliphilus]
MNLGNRINSKNSFIRIEHTRPDAIATICQTLLSWTPVVPREYVVVFVGTDRSTGDALGPLAGSYLSELKPKHLTIYGTLHQPIHATNMEESLAHIYHVHHNPFIIAVDACLGKTSSIGTIIAERAPLKPGAALNKTLPEIGDVHITGVVNVSGFMSYAVLQNTRLSIVVDMAKKIAATFEALDQQLTYYSVPTAMKRLSPDNQTV